MKTEARVASAAPGSAGPPEVCRVQPCSPAETFGVRRGFLLLLIGRMEWPSFPAQEMIEELASSRRPLCLVLQAPEAPAAAAAAAASEKLREAAAPARACRTAAEVPPPPPPLPPLRPPLQPPLPLQAPSPAEPPPALYPPGSVDPRVSDAAIAVSSSHSPVPYRCEGRSERRFPEPPRSRPKSADASSLRLQERRRMEVQVQVQEPREPREPTGRNVTAVRPRHVARGRPAAGDRASARAVCVRPSSSTPTLGVQEQACKVKTATQRPASASATSRLRPVSAKEAFLVKKPTLRPASALLARQCEA
eukprot:s7761_g3.t1